MSTIPTEPAAPAANPHAPSGPIVTFDAWCNACGYNLLGLPISGVCPECGKAVEQSLRGDLLSNCAPEHIATLLKGVTYVLNGILASVVLSIVGVIAAMIAGATKASGVTTITLGMQLVNLAVSAVILYGWWLFSTLDPAYTGRHDASKARTWIRNLLIATIPVSVIGMIIGYVAPTVLGLTITIGVISTGIWVARYFFEMSYVRWLAPRIPNEKVAKRARTLLWLGPVLYTVGLLLLGLGPLIALILYWNLLHWIRLDLRKIKESQALGGQFPLLREG